MRRESRSDFLEMWVVKEGWERRVVRRVRWMGGGIYIGGGVEAAAVGLPSLLFSVVVEVPCAIRLVSRSIPERSVTLQVSD